MAKTPTMMAISASPISNVCAEGFAEYVAAGCVEGYSSDRKNGHGFMLVACFALLQVSVC